MELIFQAKRRDNREWVDGYYVRLHDHKGNVSHRIYTGYAETDCGDFYPDWFEVDPSTVRRYIGLTDKYEDMIFEGDIVNLLTENDEFGVITYSEAGFVVSADGFCVDFRQNIDGKDVEIVGNVYDDPKLVEGFYEVGTH